MSKNIIIQEGGANYQFTAKKLKTDQVGGGTCLWVPEEEVSLGTKSISANGTYKASDDGKYGFSQVTVNVAGGKGSADNSGQPISPGVDPDIGSSFIGIDPTDGNPYEYIVNSQGEVEKTPVSITTPSDTGSSFVGIDPTDGEPYEYTVNPQGEVEKTPVSTVTPGGPGSGVVGTDPEDGNEYFIGIDENGSIVKTKIPSGIEIAKAPNETSYAEGATINYSGIIVILKGGDSAIFSNSKYPNGRIPYGELVFPVRVAPDGNENANTSIDGINITVLNGSGKYETTTGDIIAIEYSGCDFCLKDAMGRIFFAGPADSMNVTASYNGSTSWLGLRSGGTTEVINNIRYKGIWLDNGWGGWPYPGIAENPNILIANHTTDVLRTIYGSGNFTSTTEIPVQWTSPYDGRTFEDTFEITVTSDSGSGSTDGGGYSDDSGGSSSGGGTSF